MFMLSIAQSNYMNTRMWTCTN